MRRTEQIITTTMEMLKEKPDTIKAVIAEFETSGGYWLTEDEKNLIKYIVKCW